jgi:hypothetical protein
MIAISSSLALPQFLPCLQPFLLAHPIKMMYRSGSLA